MAAACSRRRARTIAAAAGVAGAGILALTVALQARAASTEVVVGPLTVVNGKATGTISGFEANETVTIEGKGFVADPNGVVTLNATPLDGDSSLAIQFTDAQGRVVPLNTELRDSVTGDVLTPLQLSDQVADATREVRVTVSDGGTQGGSTTGSSSGSGSTGSAGSETPAGAIRLAGGVSIPAASVDKPARLVVDRVRFSPNPLRSHSQVITARVRVKDTRGFLVRDAIVFVRGVPERRVRPAAEKRTRTDGTVVFKLHPTKLLELRKGGTLVVFVRARKAGEPVTGGVTGRRLVQLRLGTAQR